MMNVRVISGIAVVVLIDRTEVNIRISPMRFTDGGALMFAAAARNHQKVRDGISVIMPLVKNRFRVLVVWYERFAKVNSMGEIRPWASMVIRAPDHPKLVNEVTAARNSPMWATDE